MQPRHKFLFILSWSRHQWQKCCGGLCDLSYFLHARAADAVKDQDIKQVEQACKSVLLDRLHNPVY